MRKRGLYQSLHPFGDHPFEVFYHGSWQTVERLRISGGTVALNILDFGYMFEEKGLFNTLRLRPRRAVSSDCICFLRPGVNVSVLSTFRSSKSLSVPNPAWLDAKIISIEREPHETECCCKFYVKFFGDPTGTKRRKLGKDIELVGLNRISIFQNLAQRPCENVHYRWNFTEDSTSAEKTKLFLGKFLSDITWLVVASVQNQIAFDVRSIQNKLVYQVLEGMFDRFSLDMHLTAVNFKFENSVCLSVIVPFVPSNNVEILSPVKEAIEESGPLVCYDHSELRRSKRRKVRPERYMGAIGLEEQDTTSLRIGYKKHNKDDDMAIVLADVADFDHETHLPNDASEPSLAIELFTDESFLVSKVSPDPREKKPKPVPGDGRERKPRLVLAPVQQPAGKNKIPMEKSHLVTEIGQNLSDLDDNITLRQYIRRRAYSSRSRKTNDRSDYLEDDPVYYRRERKFSNSKPVRRHRSFVSSRRDRYEDRSKGKKKTLDLEVYKDLISTYMKNIQLTIENKHPVSVDPWTQLQGSKSMFEKKNEEEYRDKRDEDEDSETEMLWREMELCLASEYLQEEENTEIDECAEAVKKFFKTGGEFCQHEFKVDEEIGVLCSLCGYVITEIKDVSPPFMQSTAVNTKRERVEKDDTEQKLLHDACSGLVYNPGSCDAFVSESNDNVWSLIPIFRKKLHVHQMKAFEFLWRNLAGSMIPSEMEPLGKKVGGCVISHAPGAGKTFLIIAFLVSYLKLFPGKRPLVLAPKTTLYTWYKEIIKWEFPVPVYQIHGRKTYRDRIYMQRLGTSSMNVVPNGDIMHVLDCLEKIQKWHAHPSVLLMGYTSFLSLMREDSKYAHRRYMGKILRESPGILILDEGHNPRSTKSRLRKALMRVETEFRIMLSGTLFQNNFGEYFNTLCLARPKFVNEVLRVLDPKYKKKIKGQKKTRTSIENRARKVFMDIIASKINSNDPEERLEGLNMLKNMTNGFIDVYEAGSSENLPGLQSYTLMMKPTPIQNEILVNLHRHMSVSRGFPLELELMITLGSIHPWLIKTAVCANKFLSNEELARLDEYKLDPTKGSKVKFVLGLVQRSIIRREKVLIFCHNIAPINLFVLLFEMIYGWRKGNEVLVLSGELELFERGRVMDKFEERGGPSKVLLASINACAEGITLTAASRVVLLDSEWNPSKQKQAIARAFRPGQEKVVYVYQLLVNGTLEEDKYGRTTWKEWVSCMIFSEELVDDPSKWQAEKIEDALLREIVEEDHAKSFHMIMKNEKASYENPLKVAAE